jgi:alkanesulfonate monooxygenase SsuD/methylene tetrahydromethanopterin reductase-like flavin-dependent oxidoreductase (luciferase family)
VGRGFGVTAAVDHDVVGALAREVERLGYSSFWANDIPDAEGLTSLAAAAHATTRIQLGVGVIPLDQRSPAHIAQRVRELGLPLDRLWLGVGSGNRRQALTLAREGVTQLAGELGAPVVVGALGPRMSALAGEVADGVLFNWMTPQYTARVGQLVLDAAEAASRPRPALMAYVRCGLLPAAEARLSQELERYSGIATYERHVERMGASVREACVTGPDSAAMQVGISTQEAVLDETIVRAITPDDSLDSLIELVHACAPGPAPA